MFATLLLVAAVAPPPAKPSPAQIAKWVAQLGDDSFAVREAASAQLRAAGAVSERALTQALDSKDAEVRNRAKTILAEFKWGIYPDTPPAILELIQSYRGVSRSERATVIRKLLDAGPVGCRAVIKIAQAEDNPDVRRLVFPQYVTDVERKIAALLDEGNRPRAEALLELGRASNTRAGILNYAAYAALSGQLDERLADWQFRAKQAVVAKEENEILTYLHRAGGDGKSAARTAKEADDVALLEAMLYENADWKALAENPSFTDRPTRNQDDQISSLGYKTAYYRLGGKSKLYDAMVDRLAKGADDTVNRRFNSLPYAKALFLNGRGDLGLQILQKSNYSPKLTFEILSVQTKMKEAFAVVEEARKSGSRESRRVVILEARTLYQLGEKERALTALKSAVESIQPGPDESWYQDLVEAELALDRRAQAITATAKILTATKDTVRGSRLFDKLFDPYGDETWALYQAMRRHGTNETIENTIQRVSSFLDGKGDVKPVVESLRESKLDVSSDDWWAVGEACTWCKQSKLAIECFRMANNSRSWIRLGDQFAATKEWLKAAKNYQAAYVLALKSEKPAVAEGTPCLALWLAGHALIQAGRLDEGKLKQQRAHLLPLGNGEMRFEFVRALRKRKHKEAIGREEECLRRLCEPLLSEPDSYFTGEGMRSAAIEAADRKDWLAAANGYEQTFLRCLQPTMNFTRGSAYVTVPGHVYVTRARGLVAAGRIDEARVEIERALHSQPANVELAMHVVPALDQRDRKKEANELYRQVRQCYLDVLKDYPKCTWARNQLAWLSACCRRDLEDGHKQIRRAIELVPDSPSYHDTLAEVLFQMGKKNEAIQAQKKAIELAPSRDEYKKRLKRIEAGDPNAPRIEDE